MAEPVHEPGRVDPVRGLFRMQIPPSSTARCGRQGDHNVLLINEKEGDRLKDAGNESRRGSP
jgi:hypothetical protein